MKTVNVLFCVIIKKTTLDLRSSSTFPTVVQNTLPLLPLPKSEVESCEGSDCFSEFLASLVVFFFVLMVFSTLDKEVTKASAQKFPRRNDVFQKSLVQIILVPKTKVTPLPKENNSLALKSRVRSVKQEDMSKKANGSFSFRPGFLTKKRRPNPETFKQVTQSSLVGNLNLKRAPELISEGNVSIVFKLFSDNKTPTAIFKPYEAFPNSMVESALVSGNGNDEDRLLLSTKKQVLSEVCAYRFDQQLSSKCRANVPETQLVKMPAKVFSEDQSESTDLTNKFIRGSIQRYIDESESCEDLGPSLFDKDNVHRIGILDLRILNCDRHMGNMLYKPKTKQLLPIDHALSFPSIDFDVNDSGYDPGLDKDLNNLDLSHVSFDWMMFPQAKQSFSEEFLREIKSIDILKDLAVMKKFNMSVKQRLAVFMATSVLKIGALRYRKTLYDLGAIIQRTGARTQPSVIEQLAVETVKRVDKNRLLRGDESQVQAYCEEFNWLLEKFFKV